ncbi:MAG TPA: DsbC family protein [Burkholderiaceae bacterium]|nr:DsbC family protein [Burkholderiaceae bacterium]
MSKTDSLDPLQSRPETAKRSGRLMVVSALALSVAALAAAIFATWSTEPAHAQGSVPAQAAAPPKPGEPAKTASDPTIPAESVAAVNKALGGLSGGHTLDELRRTPLPGILEARIGSDLIYIDETGRYIFMNGDLIDLQSRRNLTQERVDDLMAIDFSELPLELAFQQVNGKGERRIAVFEDPNCGYCKRLRADLLKLDNVTIHTFPMAFLAADSESKARKALCAPDKAQAWNDLLVQGKVPDNAGTCDTSLEAVRELTRKLGITGTPVVFFPNGRRLVGYVPPARFSQMLAEYSVR